MSAVFRIFPLRPGMVRGMVSLIALAALLHMIVVIYWYKPLQVNLNRLQEDISLLETKDVKIESDQQQGRLGKEESSVLDAASLQQQARQRTLTDFCSSHSKTHTHPHIMVDYKNKVMWCKIAKAASSSLLMFFMKQAGGENITFTDGVHYRGPEQLGLYKLETYNATQQKYIKENFRSFFFARDPLDRLRSAYSDKIKDKNKPRKYSRQIDVEKWDKEFRAILETVRPNKTYKELPAQPGITFQEFVQYVIENEKRGIASNGHWETIERICAPCGVHYDYIGHVETMDEDVVEVQRKIYQQSSVQPIGHVHELKSKRVDMSIYNELTKKQLIAIKKVYANDEKMMGYDFSNVKKHRLDFRIGSING